MGRQASLGVCGLWLAVSACSADMETPTSASPIGASVAGKSGLSVAAGMSAPNSAGGAGSVTKPSPVPTTGGSVATAPTPAQAGAKAAVGGSAGLQPMAAAGGSGMTSAMSAGASAAAGSAGRAMSPGAGGSAGMATGMMDAMDCAGGMVGKASNAAGGGGRGNGNVQFTIGTGNQILRLQTTMEVPVRPNGNTTFFLWPGLEPLQGSEHYSPIGTGVLQPVLTWGGSCAPGSPQTRTGDKWWISAQYVNTLGSDPKHKGCYGGPTMNVETGDKLLIEMFLEGTIWKQVITNQANGKKVDFSIDMEMQSQRWALFQIEMPTSTKPAADTIFTDTVITMAKSEPKACTPTVRGANDYYSAPVSSADGLRCCVSRLVLRAAGVAATSMDPAP